MNLIENFREIRKVSTPWVCVKTTDYRATIKALRTVKINGKEESPPIIMWTCVDGPVCISSHQIKMGSEEDPPFVVLTNALKLPEETMLFFVVPDDTIFTNSFTIQAIANLRDEFKTNRRTLIILGVDPKLPEFVREDIPMLEDPLPNFGEITKITKSIVDMVNLTLPEKEKLNLPQDEISKASSCCLGMTRFSVEEAVSRKIRKSIGIDLVGLAETQKTVIEQSSGGTLAFETAKWRFSDIGGLENYKKFITCLYNGPRKPKLIVRIDEIEKSISTAASGNVADNTGVSQDMLKVFLTFMEDNKWLGLLAAGQPGSGKTLSSICTGNEFQTRTLSMDLGAAKGSLVGESEKAIRRAFEIVKTMGGNDVLFIATCNKLETLPPEFQARFNLGTWMWDSPTKEERKVIWEIQRKAFNINEKDKTPNDEDWVGRDIRNCCQMSWMLNTNLKEASEFISIAGKTAKPQIESLRKLAAKSGFRSASYPGAYCEPRKEEGRKLSLEN